jgi:hypothetical protein
LIDSVIVRVCTDRSHVWEGKGRRVSERMSGGCGGRGREDEWAAGYRSSACGKGTWQQLASKQQDAKRAGKRRSKGTREKETEERKKGNENGETLGPTGRGERGEMTT